jgi:pteridine reductase
MQNNKVALITGSGRRRIGNVIARSLAEDGYSIALHYLRSADSAEATAEELRGLGITCECYQANVAVQYEVDEMFDAVADKFGRLDALVTTAAIWESISLEETTADDLWRSFNVNTLGTFNCVRRAGLQMAAQTTGGAIVTVGDWAIERPYPDHAAYFIAKGAIPTLTKTLAVELGRRNPRVRVNCVHPGPVMFPPDSNEQACQSIIDATLVKQGNDPRVLADAIKFLITNDFITGVCLPVDGGRTIFAGGSKLEAQLSGNSWQHELQAAAR